MEGVVFFKEFNVVKFLERGALEVWNKLKVGEQVSLEKDEKTQILFWLNWIICLVENSQNKNARLLGIFLSKGGEVSLRLGSARGMKKRYMTSVLV